MNLAKSPTEGSRIPTKISLPGDTEKDCVCSMRKHIFGETGETIAASRNDRKAQVTQRLKTDRRESATSYTSYQSDLSLEQPPNISDGEILTSRLKTDRRESATSYTSYQSDTSIEQPPNISDGEILTSRLKTDRRESATSYTSYQSDLSLEQPPNISDGEILTSRLKTDRRESATSYTSYQSDLSVEQPPNISDGEVFTSRVGRQRIRRWRHPLSQAPAAARSLKADRRESSASSCFSIQSDSSTELFPHIRDGAVCPLIRPERNRPPSPSPSCVSIKSDSSFDKMIGFGQAGAHDHRRPVKDRPPSPSPSCVSIKSDSFFNKMIGFGQAGAHNHHRPERDRPPSPSPSCVSITSDSSFDKMIGFGQAGAHDHRRPVKDRPPSPSPSCVSIKIDSSFNKMIGFGQAGAHNHHRMQTGRLSPSVSICISEPSDESIERPPCLRETSTTSRLQVEASMNMGEGAAPYAVRWLSYRPSSPSPSHTSTGSDRSLDKFPDFTATSQSHLRRQSSESIRSCGSQQQPPHVPEEKAFVYPQNTTPNIQRVIEGHKASLKKKFEVLSGWSTKPSCDVPFHAIYTNMHITEGANQGINVEHEVQQMEMMHSRKTTPTDEAINCNDIFRPLRGEQRPIRTVLTKGIAGIGKTIFVQKFILDWAEGRANQDVDFVFLLPFRELNLVCNEQHSLHTLLMELFKDIQDMEVYKECKLLFIFDGLDESKLCLDFQQKEMCDVNKATSVSTLVTNLIQGHLLPTALIWVTSRPAATRQIPTRYIDQVTELKGFNDPQKEEFLRRRVANQKLADKIIAHVRATRSLLIMCHIPVFCLLVATVFQQIMEQKPKRDIPNTLTKIFTEFITTQINTRQRSQESSREAILKLAKLAFTHLQKQQFNFYEEDLKECEIDTNDASVFSGLCIDILKEESIGRGKRTYCFLHLTIQEFLAALFVIHSFVTKNTEALQSCHGLVSDKNMELYDLLKAAVDKSLQSEYGHLDLFLRFLLGLSLEPSQKLLQGLLKSAHSRPSDVTKKITEYMDLSLKAQTRKGIISYIKELRKENLSPERCINLFHCLIEMRDFTMQEEIQEYLRSERYMDYLSPAHCSALAHMLLMSEEAVEELDLRRYNTSDEGRKRLVPAVRWCRKARLDCCKLTVRAYETVVLSLQSPGSPLTELDLSYNSLRDSGLELLAQGLKSPHCKLQTLRLVGCHLTESSCLTMASVLQSERSALRELDLSDNELQDLGVEHLASGLRSHNCKVHTLRLCMCLVSTRGCTALTEALSCNPFHLKDLNLCYNYPRSSGVQQLSAKLQDPDCALETLNLKHAGWYRLLATPQKYFCKLHLDPNTAHRNLTLSERNQEVTRGPAQAYPDHTDHTERFDCWPQVLCKEPLTGRCYWEVEWTGTAAIGLAYKSICRKGGGDDVVLGHNFKSVSLYCDKDSYSVYYGKKKTEIEFSPFGCSRVGVFLDWPTGSVSFYQVSSKGLLLLHTVYSSFSKPLYAGFTIYPSDTVVSLCRIKE